MTRRAAAAVLDRAWGIGLGMALDSVIGDPRRFHPVAGFGRAAAAFEGRIWADSRWRGTVFTLATVGAVTAGGALVSRLARSSRVARIGLTAVAVWATVGGTSLKAEGDALHRLLAAGDLPGARERLTHLVSRSTDTLAEAEIARATVESVAENSSDAIVAPLFWGAVAGVPGLVGYRAINTLDAMVGYRNERYERFGWASARLDDAANYLPSRATAAMAAALSGGRARPVWRQTTRFARRHPSPNAGWCEAAYAASLGLTLGGRNTYGDRVEERPLLGDGAAPASADIERAIRLTARVAYAATACAMGLAAAANLLARALRRQSRR